MRKHTPADLHRLLERIQLSAGSSWQATDNGDLVHTNHTTRDVWVFPTRDVLEELIDAKNALGSLALGHLSLADAVGELNSIGLRAMDEVAELDAQLREAEAQLREKIG